ncbi:polysaccharide deacetylase family protein [Actinocrinis sp.]|uniref:polysaccharide deacetylase family protein n=1 Tax=Actinocrinis sp. TaxID=1920516 RepID=UPI002D63D3DE|nr:polysaccharide deacetylase family protein [Actinocrinis sp.]HZP50029.1 polysaccharide deacetylase family protein [Actinocrinis sp.]
MSVPEDEPWRTLSLSRRDALRAAWTACAVAAATEGCSSAGGGGHAGSTRQPGPSATSTASGTGPPVAVSASGSAVPRAAVANGVALTFHGDGTPSLATALLSEAERAGARVTVLAVGRWLGTYPQMARRVLDGGHELGNHTEHHIDIDALSADAAYAEIEDCATRLQKLTGSRGRWFRPSQAQHATATVRAAAVRAGYQTVLSYDLDSLDYTDPGADAVVHNVLSAVHAGDVVSMHLGHAGTVTALPAILDGLRTRGLQAVTASELFPQPLSISEVAHR